MNLGISGRTAIVCSVTTDLGQACAQALVEEGVMVYMTGVGQEQMDRLERQMEMIDGAAVRCIACDIATPNGRDAILEACPEPDILINHAPGPPSGDFRYWSRDDWMQALDLSMFSAIELIKSVYDGMVTRDFGRIVNITSQSVKSPMANLDLSNAARGGLTGFVAGVSREARSANVTINNLLPGLFATKPLAAHIQGVAKKEGISHDDAAQRLLAGHPLRRLGLGTEFGACCAFLCSEQAAYINGQNILVDGGAFRAVM